MREMAVDGLKRTEMLLEMRAVEPFYKNGFVLACERSREAVIIDPGDEVEELLQIVKSRGLTVRHILLTHAHVDHVTGVGRAKQALNAPVSLHSGDKFLYDNAVHQGRMFGIPVDAPPPIDRFYDRDASPITFGDFEVKWHHTPGHCPGGVCLQVGRAGESGKTLIVGDTLFSGSIGRTDLPGGDHATLIASIKNVLFAFGDDAVVFPGHGPQTTIGQERRTNPYLA
jgi:glyoxylase-like metal-dependent hydrolase (beta-lactamase superfamily II)